jgi:hypothetical protein
MSRSRRCDELSAMNGANGMSDIEGKAARVAASECGQRASFNYEAYCRRVRRWRPRASKK